ERHVSSFFIRTSNLERHPFSSIKPFRRPTVFAYVHAPPPECPAHVGDGDEERRGEAIDLADLAAEERGLPAEAHRTDAGLIGFLQEASLERGELGIGIGVLHGAEELLFRVGVAGGAVAADANAENAGAAALSLGLEDGVEDRVFDALQIAAAEV